MMQINAAPGIARLDAFSAARTCQCIPAVGIVLCCLLLAGCDTSPAGESVGVGAVADTSPAVLASDGDRASAGVSPDGTAQAADTAAAARAAIEGRLSEGMAYADLREGALAAGWLPIEDPQCAENVGGEARVCRVLPEVESCSSDGRCAMWFGHAASAARLRVDTYGDAAGWVASGEDSEVIVRTWSFAAGGAAAMPDVTCPAQAFPAFLAAFSSDEAVRDAFTRPLVSVMRYRDVGEDILTSAVLVPAAHYDGFRLRHDGTDYHIVAADGTIDPQSTAVEVSQTGPATQRVAYQYGMSEGSTYEFRQERSCWYLAAEPVAAGS